ncbi:HAD family hydrolase [Rhizohabitans arisaemae]|uniref:HAD family hydrolase n=1 Tax=Rhizohabitans arisaemae TaxID=2720610 RepID=UPI0024B13719|nr:HAD hydrolase-like protein [Rhizohabitans arisaemae]
MRHIIWDWNGTLFHDIDAVVGATNELFRSYEIGPLTHDGFRACYTRPIWVLYERLLRRSLDEGEFDRLDREFHEHYHRLMLACDLSEGARTALQGWQEAGGGQSLLSMWEHGRLVPKVEEFGIHRHFSRVDGLRSEAGGHKAEHMVAHIEALGLDAKRILVIGDSVDDATAAAHVGAEAILFTGGMTSRADLERTGVPVVDSLAEALARA